MRGKAHPSVSIVRVKQFAIERLPVGSALREVLVAEPDELPPEEYVVKLSVWLKLLRQAT